jgi:hypothetical protein
MADVKFISIESFKTQVGTTKVQILRNEKTGKLFMSTDSGDTYRVQADINQKEEMRILVPETGIEDACLINVSGGATNVFSL